MMDVLIFKLISRHPPPRNPEAHTRANVGTAVANARKRGNEGNPGLNLVNELERCGDRKVGDGVREASKVRLCSDRVANLATNRA